MVNTSIQCFTDMLNICGVVTDSAPYINARKVLNSEYRLVAKMPDRAFLSDMLMKDLTKFPWIKAILSRITHIVTEMRSHKLYLLKAKWSTFKCNENFTSRFVLHYRSQCDRQDDLKKCRAWSAHHQCIIRFSTVEEMVQSYILDHPVLTKHIFEGNYRTFSSKTEAHELSNTVRFWTMEHFRICLYWRMMRKLGRFLKFLGIPLNFGIRINALF